MHKFYNNIIFIISFISIYINLVNTYCYSGTINPDDQYIVNILKKNIPEDIKNFCSKYSDALLTYSDKANLISSDAQFCLGIYYLDDDDDKAISIITNSNNAGIFKNDLKISIFKLMDNMCSKGNKNACRTLAYYYIKGIGTDINLNNAIKLYTSNLLKDDEYAAMDLADILTYEISTPESIDNAMKIYKELSQSDNKYIKNKAEYQYSKYPTYKYLECLELIFQTYGNGRKLSETEKKEVQDKLRKSYLSNENDDKMVSEDIKRLVVEFLKANKENRDPILMDLTRQLTNEKIAVYKFNIPNKGK